MFQRCPLRPGFQARNGIGTGVHAGVVIVERRGPSALRTYFQRTSIFGGHPIEITIASIRQFDFGSSDSSVRFRHRVPSQGLANLLTPVPPYRLFALGH
jgi:hypothetical protein